MKYTKEEDLIIMKEIKKNPQNIVSCCENASKILKNRTTKSIYVRYYNFLKKKYNILSVGSSKGFSKNNIKNQKRSYPGEILKPDLQPFQMIVKDMLELSLNERKRILDFFK